MMVVVVILLAVRPLATAERLRAPDGSVRDVPTASAEFALKDGYTRIPKVLMRRPMGMGDSDVYEIDEDAVDDALARGWWRLTPSEIAARENAAFHRFTARDARADDFPDSRDLAARVEDFMKALPWKWMAGGAVALIILATLFGAFTRWIDRQSDR